MKLIIQMTVELITGNTKSTQESNDNIPTNYYKIYGNDKTQNG